MLLVGLLALFYCVGVFSKGFDRDEWQTMVAAAGVAGGEKLYVDIWDNHGPLLTVVLGGLMRLVDSRNDALLMFGGRLLMLGLLLTTLWITGRLARRAWPGSALAGPLSMVVLLCSQTFFGKGLEIRPDVPLLLSWTLCLLFLLRGIDGNKRSDFLWAGLALGTGFAFSLKTLLTGAACGLAMLTVMIRRRRFSFGPLLSFGTGVLPAPLLTLLGLHLTGSLQAFLDSYLGQNLDRMAEPWLTGLKKAWQAEELMLLALAAAIVFLLQYRRRTPLPDGIVALAVVSVTLLGLYLRLPTHYDQSLLPLLPGAAVVIAYAIGQGFEIMPPGRRRRAIFLLLIIAVAAGSMDHAWFRYESHRDLQLARDRQTLLPATAGVFEGVGLPLFQPRPFIYKAFVNTLCFRIRSGQLGIDIPAELDRKNVAYATLDKRVRKMGNEIQTFILQNYLPLRAGELLAAGTILPAHPGHGTVWNVRIAGRYFIGGGASLSNLRVDGRPASAIFDLTDGPHTFAWEGNAPLIISIAPPPQWPADETLLEWKRQNLPPQNP
jgi:hypothetical protein